MVMRTVLGAMIAVPLAALPAAAEPAPVRATYDFYFGGLHVLTAAAEYGRSREDYSVTAEAVTRGIVSVFFDWKGWTQSTGRFEQGRAVPERHESRGTDDGETRRMALSYDADGDVVDILVDPAPDLEEVTPLPEGAELGTVDPLTVIAELGGAVSSGGSCDGAYSVFDGKRRYELSVSDAGRVPLEANSYSVFSGTALACQVDYQMMGGERREKNKYSRTARDRIVFVAPPFDGVEPIPVALKIETDYGTLMAHLTSVEAGDRRLALPTD